MTVLAPNLESKSLIPGNMKVTILVEVFMVFLNKQSTSIQYHQKSKEEDYLTLYVLTQHCHFDQVLESNPLPWEHKFTVLLEGSMLN